MLCILNNNTVKEGEVLGKKRSKGNLLLTRYVVVFLALPDSQFHTFACKQKIHILTINTQI